MAVYEGEKTRYSVATPNEHLEQEARMALKEDYRSQMQSCKTIIVTLFVVYFAGIGALRVLSFPDWFVVCMFCLASGVLVGGVFYFWARLAWYGIFSACVLFATPIDLVLQTDSRQNTNTLVCRIEQGTTRLVKKELGIEEERSRSKIEQGTMRPILGEAEKKGRTWLDRLASLGNTEHTWRLVMVSLILGGLTVDITLWLFYLGLSLGL